MFKKHQFRKASKKTKSLLVLEENRDVEFKESIQGLDSSDIASFANSEHGGSVLIGVREIKLGKKRHKGEIIGCLIGDGEKRKILDKAESCVPPISVEIHVVKLKHKSFYRVDIPSGRDKPYCTSGGNYKIRGDGRSLTLTPNRLLIMFAEKEGETFIKKFKQATKELELDIKSTKENIIQEMSEIYNTVIGMESNIDDKLESIFGSVEDASSEASSFVDELYNAKEEIIRALEIRICDVESKLAAVLNKFDIIDPTLEPRVRLLISQLILRNLKVKSIERIKKEEIFEMIIKSYPRVDKTKVQLWIKEAIAGYSKALGKLPSSNFTKKKPPK